MSTTIREVVIRVSVENGSMSLGPIDTSAITQQLQRVGSVSRGRPNYGNWGSAAGATASGILRQGGASDDLAERLAMEGANYPTADQRKTRIADAVQAQNERDVAHRADIKRQKELRKKREDEDQERMDLTVGSEVRRTNKEKSANKSKLESGKRELEERAAATDRATQSTIQLTKSLAMLAATGSESDREMVRTVVTIESLAKAAANAGALTNPYVAGIVAATGAILAWRVANQYAIESMKEFNRQMGDVQSRNLAMTQSTLSRHLEQGQNEVSGIPDASGSARAYGFSASRKLTEQSIRKLQGSSNADFGFKQEIRAREERQQGLHERQREFVDRGRHIGEQMGANERARSRFEADKIQSQRAYEAKQKAIEEKKIQPKYSSRGMSWLGALNHDVHERIMGRTTQNDADIHNLGVQAESKQAEADRQKEINAETAKGIALQQESLQLGKAKVDALAGQLQVTREMAIEARKAAERDREEIRSGKETVGGMSPGERNRFLRIQKKALAGQKLNYHELQIASSVPGLAADEARRQKEQLGEGYAGHTDRAKRSEDRAAALESQVKAAEPGLEKQLYLQDAKNQELAGAIATALAGAIGLGDTLAEIKKVADQLQLEFDAFKLKGGHLN